MKIKFDGMNGKEKNLYEEMWSDFDFGTMSVEVRRTKGSSNSYCFVGESDKKQLLARAFDIENIDLFSEKYDMVTSGSGDEDQKITILRSSSLCALLHFYNVTKENPLCLEFITDKGKRKVEFIESFFEYKSPVIRKPSNMDVVLFGKDINENKDIILFLESKFSEYYIDANNVKYGISRQYLREDRVSAPLYESSMLKRLGLRREDEDKGHFKLETIGEQQIYIEGIKQMISHFTGITNVINGKLYKGKKPANHKEVDKAIQNKEYKIILGEIVFDRIIEKLEGSNYSKEYHELSLGIAEQIKGNNRFEIITEELGYSLFKGSDHKIEPKIKAFYRY